MKIGHHFATLAAKLVAPRFRTRCVFVTHGCTLWPRRLERHRHWSKVQNSFKNFTMTFNLALKVDAHSW